MGQRFFEDKIGTLSHSSGVISLAASRITIGGQQYYTTGLSRTISTDVTMTANTLYMVFAVFSGGTVQLRISANYNSVGPSGFTEWCLVGAFYSDGSSVLGSFGNIVGRPTFSLMNYTSVWTAATTNPVLNNGTISANWGRDGDRGLVNISVLSGNTTTYGSGGYFFSLPSIISSIINVPGTFGPIGVAKVDLSANAYTGYVFYAGSGLLSMQTDATSARVGSATPVAPTASTAGQQWSINASFTVSGWSNTPIKDL